MNHLRAIAVTLSLLIVSLPLCAADIIGDTNVEPQTTVKLSLSSLPEKGSAVWRIKPLDKQDMKKLEWISDKKGKAIRWIAPQGRYEVIATIASIAKDGTLDLDYGETIVTIGPPVPVPPPIPPTPPDPPTPPVPPPSPSPFPGDGLRVLMIYESADASNLTAAQQAVLYGKAVREYLNSKCPVGPDGKTKEWRIYDKDVDTTGEAKIWGEAMKRPRTSDLWLVVGNGKQGYEGPLPKTQDEMLKLLKKFGG